MVIDLHQLTNHIESSHKRDMGGRVITRQPLIPKQVVVGSIPITRSSLGQCPYSSVGRALPW